MPIAELHRSLEISYTLTSQSSFRQAECGVIIDALKATSGRIAGKGGAAERLGLRRTTLQNKLRRLGISRAHYCLSLCFLSALLISTIDQPSRQLFANGNPVAAFHQASISVSVRRP